jgi:hypothetical protein
MNADILLEHLHEYRGKEVCFGIVEVGRTVTEVVEESGNPLPHQCGPLLHAGQISGNVDVLSARQASCTNQTYASQANLVEFCG